jgi:hypothetical protein
MGDSGGEISLSTAVARKGDFISFDISFIRQGSWRREEATAG